MCQGYELFFYLLCNKLSEANYYDFKSGILVIACLVLFHLMQEMLVLTGKEAFALINFHSSAITNSPFFLN